jgi:hypothetical protein
MSGFLALARGAGKAFFFSALAVYGLGCGAAASAQSDDSAGSGATGGTSGGGTGGTGMPAAKLELLLENDSDDLFTPDSTVTLDPREERTVWVHASDGERVVRFALLPNDEQNPIGPTMPADAALDQTELWTDTEGYGQVLLTAPGSPTTFLLRASSGTLDPTSLRFSVQQMNRAELEVVPLYAGTRPVERWTASVTPNADCSTLMGSPPPDGEHRGESAGNGSVLLSDVPVGVPFAVTVRAEHFAWGCANLATAVEGSVPQRVEIVVTDVQIRLDESRAKLELSLDSLDGWVGTLQAPLAGVNAAVRDGAEDDVAALLDAMQAELDGSERAVFSSTRDAERWETRVREQLGESAGTLLGAAFERWLPAGLEGLSAENAFSGELAPSEAAAGSAEFTLASVFGLEPAEAGFTVESLGPWSAMADSVLIGFSLEFAPSAFVVAAAEKPARAEVDGAESVAEALAALLPCSAVAAALTTFGDCSADCREDLCVDALASLVERLAALDMGDVATLAVATSGDAAVGPNANLEALDGTWIGKLEYDEMTVDVGGSASVTSLDD